ncbi:MAG TPA: glucose-6-phosphate dehydrogenase assembly protein OpcA [Gaiellaceae bacterium]|nr:glucose-6-phosphate dehydrogenase assembly protein OpcA [Gaiellaceae bacterium]
MTTVGELERDLARLREASSDPGAPPRLRTSVMTHIAWVPERWIEAATGTLAGLAERHPSRAILLFPQPDDPTDSLEGEVDLRCFVRQGVRKEVCAEVITLRLCGARASVPASVVMPLLVSDLPVFLRWRGPLPFGSAELEQLVDIADRLVVDAVEWDEPARDCRELSTLFDRVAVSDIAWARTLPWRVAVAEMWPDVADAKQVTVAGPLADALLLSAWLESRLGHEVALDHEPADEIERVEVDGDEARPLAADLMTPSDFLSDQLEMFGRDPIYEEAARRVASRTTTTTDK